MTTPLETYLPAKTYEEALHRACKLWGVQEEYWDIWGNLHTAELDVRRTVLQSMGVPAGSLESLNSAMEDQARQEWFSLASPTIVATISARRVPVQIAEREAAGRLTVEFLWENGDREQFEFPVASLEDGGAFSIGDQIFLRKLLPLPVDVALGYHTLRVSLDAKAWAESRLIVCPDRAYLPESLENGGKVGGIAVSLYGLRSERNWGCGDFSDLKDLTEWAATKAGVDFVALNPLHSIPNRQPYNTSPYLPNCTFYRNPLYLDIERIEDIRRSRWAQAFLKSPKVQSRLAEYRKSEHVEYEKVYAIKLRFLKLAFREFLKEYRQKGPRAADFKAFLEGEGVPLDKYALYSAIDETIHKSNRDIWIWPDWPAEFKDLKSPQIAAFYRAHWRLILFYKYIQWQVDLQLSEAQRFARAQGMAIGLYHDLALATDRCGSDLWAHGPFYISGCRVGSPPDGFAPKGQDWAFPPPNSLAHRQNGYRMFAESIRKNSTHGGALRIDHVMRFFRLFWIPEGKEATDGVYVRDFSEDLLRILALESVRNRVVVIGEDLGTVEPYIREALAKYGVLSYRLLFFERNKDGSFKLPEDYPEQALVSASTHDLPTLAGFWVGRDIEARRRAGVIGEEQALEALAERAKDKQAMLDALIAKELLPPGHVRRAADIPEFTGELHNAAVGFLAKTPSMLLVLNQEDLFKVDDQQNLPGTTEQYPNWRHKMPYTIEELNANRQALDYVSMFRGWLDRTGRLRTGSVNQNPTY